jgi:hypothetical protein
MLQLEVRNTNHSKLLQHNNRLFFDLRFFFDDAPEEVVVVVVVAFYVADFDSVEVADFVVANLYFVLFFAWHFFYWLLFVSKHKYIKFLADLVE